MFSTDFVWNIFCSDIYLISCIWNVSRNTNRIAHSNHYTFQFNQKLNRPTNLGNTSHFLKINSIVLVLSYVDRQRHVEDNRHTFATLCHKDTRLMSNSAIHTMPHPTAICYNTSCETPVTQIFCSFFTVW